MHLIKSLISILFFIVLGTIVYILFSGENISVPQKILDYIPGENLQNQFNDDTNNINDKIYDILGTNNPYLCTYKINNNDTEVNGKLYLENGSILNKTIYKNNENKEISNYYLYDRKYLYTWGDEIESFKILVPNIFSDSTERNNLDLKRLGISAGLNLACNSLSKDKTYINVPNNIEFIDIEQEVNKVNETINNASKDLENTIKDIDNSIGKACEFCYNLPTEDIINECLRITNCKK